MAQDTLHVYNLNKKKKERETRIKDILSTPISRKLRFQVRTGKRIQRLSFECGLEQRLNIASVTFRAQILSKCIFFQFLERGFH